MNQDLNLLYNDPPTMTKDTLVTYRFKRTLCEAWPSDPLSAFCIYRGEALGKPLYPAASRFAPVARWLGLVA